MNKFDLDLDVLVQAGGAGAAAMSVGVTSTPGTSVAADGATSVAAGGTGVRVPGDPRIPSYNSRKKKRKSR